MGRTWSPEDIPESTLLPDGIYPFDIEGIKEDQTKKGWLMYTATYRVAEGDFVGMPQFDRFTIGTEDDPNADDPETWKRSISARQLKRLFKAAQVPLSSDVDEMCQAAMGQRFLGVIAQEIDKGERDPKYKGMTRNNFRGYYAVGEREATNVAKPAPALTRPAPRAAAAPAVPAAKPTTATKREPTVPCGECGEVVPRRLYMQHVNEKHPAE